jgi:hypothetical protein
MSAALTSTWESQRRWSQVANAAGDRLDSWRWRNLGLLGVGALMGALAAQEHWLGNGWRSGYAIVGAVALAIAGVLQRAFLGPGQVKRQTTARAASEALKAEVYRYLVGVPPYDDAGADTKLARAADRVDDAAAEYLVAKHTVALDDEPAPAIADIDDYVRERAVAQRDWHDDRVASLQARARGLHFAELTATGAAAVLAAVAGLADFAELATVAGLAAWVGLATTGSSAIAAHLAAGRYERLATTYAYTATQLDRLIRDREASHALVHSDSPVEPESGARPNHAADAAFVDAVEKVLAVQNGSWVALLNE